MSFSQFSVSTFVFFTLVSCASLPVLMDKFMAKEPQLADILGAERDYAGRGLLVIHKAPYYGLEDNTAQPDISKPVRVVFGTDNSSFIAPSKIVVTVPGSVYQGAVFTKGYKYLLKNFRLVSHRLSKVEWSARLKEITEKAVREPVVEETWELVCDQQTFMVLLERDPTDPGDVSEVKSKVTVTPVDARVK